MQLFYYHWLRILIRVLKMTQNTHSTAYQTAFHTLKTNAERLENSQNLDIDELTDLVEQSILAYKICQERINAVEQALKISFEKINVE